MTACVLNEIARCPPNPWIAERRAALYVSRSAARTIRSALLGGVADRCRRAGFQGRARRLISFEAICAQKPLLHKGYGLISFEVKTPHQARCNITDPLPSASALFRCAVHAKQHCMEKFGERRIQGSEQRIFRENGDGLHG